MGRMYSMGFSNVTVANSEGDVDFFELIAPTSGVGVLHAVYISQNTETGDAAEEILRYQIVTGNTSSGTGGTTGVEVPLSLGDPAATAVGLTVSDAIAASGTEAIKHFDAFNIRVGLIYIPTPETRITWSANRLCVRLLEGVADDIDFSGTIYWEEID